MGSAGRGRRSRWDLLHPSGAHRNVNKATTNLLEVQVAITTIYSPLQSAYTTSTNHPTAQPPWPNSPPVPRERTRCPSYRTHTITAMLCLLPGTQTAVPQLVVDCLHSWGTPQG